MTAAHDSETLDLGAKDVSRIVGCSVKTVRRAMCRGELRCYKLNARVIRTSRAHVLAWRSQVATTGHKWSQVDTSSIRARVRPAK